MKRALPLFLFLILIPQDAHSHWCSNIYQSYARIVVKPDRDQIDVAYDVPDQLVAERMPGFHWMTAYGDHTKELGYALRRVGIAWDQLRAETA